MKLFESREIPNTGHATIVVTKVPGGWLYRTSFSSSHGAGVHTVFVKDEVYGYERSFKELPWKNNF